jgi:hypothetical protein
MGGSSNRHQELAHQQARDLNGRFSSGCTCTPPLGSPSSGSKSYDDSEMEMWYVAPMLTHQQQETIMLESLEVWWRRNRTTSKGYITIDTLSIVTYLQFN